uniref:Platelet-activating factor acetylhydrolase IB subunit alpha2 n=1 Tax=Cyprinus carpio TaxID=7962 RepID=A0A8C1JPJ6_CYPCA
MNPAAQPLPVQDVQGDARWISQVTLHHTGLNLLLLKSGGVSHFYFITTQFVHLFVCVCVFQHERFVQECKDAEPDVLFIGDSMVQLMQQHEVWRDLFSPLHALNFGLAGDTTCNVLWRIQNGELQNIQPKVVVLWVGTNNHQHTAEQVSGGVTAITQILISQLPQAKIIVLGLLPRGEHQNPLREKNAAVNELLRSSVPRLGPAQFLDVSAEFVQSDGSISKHDMFDFLHLTAAGYQTLSKPLHDLLLQTLEETSDSALHTQSVCSQFDLL